jgi:Diacylglycerol kinase catalytic domain
MALVIYNPAAGDSTAKALFDDHILPLLHQHNIPIARVVQTESEGHAGSVAHEYFDKTEGPLDIILGSGDGTLREIISAISLAPPTSSRSAYNPTKVNIAIVPCGTANALYHSLFPHQDEEPVSYKLKGVRAFINKSLSKPIPLTLAITSILSPPHNGNARASPKNAIAAVVTSTAMHATILRDSESLRAEIPSIDRFKVAARNNITKWYKSFVKLFPSQLNGLVEIYDPSLKEFVPHPASDHGDPIVDLDGPFAYFLSTVNVDRLESAFRITPLVSAIPRTGAFMDVVVIRPMRDPTVHLDSPEARANFAEKSGASLVAAYNDGDHINLRYDVDGKVTFEGDGATLVEYFRCGGWEWEPVWLYYAGLGHMLIKPKPCRTVKIRTPTCFVVMDSLIPFLWVASRYAQRQRRIHRQGSSCMCELKRVGFNGTSIIFTPLNLNLAKITGLYRGITTPTRSFCVCFQAVTF